MQIAADTVPSIRYEVRTSDGQLVDSNVDGQPLEYLHGAGRLISGLENALVGKSTGDQVEVAVPPEQAYGDYDQELDIALPWEAFPEEMHEQLGEGVRFKGPHPSDQEQTVVYTIFRTEDERILASGNHPLAGQELHFKVEILDVREATDDERQQGQCCGGGECGEGECEDGNCG